MAFKKQTHTLLGAHLFAYRPEAIASVYFYLSFYRSLLLLPITLCFARVFVVFAVLLVSVPFFSNRKLSHFLTALGHICRKMEGLLSKAV